ncbi:unnamed protein product [Calypogeia fissa]
MTITVHPSNNSLASVFDNAAIDTRDLLNRACEGVSEKCSGIFQSSFTSGSSNPSSKTVSASAERFAFNYRPLHVQSVPQEEWSRGHCGGSLQQPPSPHPPARRRLDRHPLPVQPLRQRQRQTTSPSLRYTQREETFGHNSSGMSP